MEEFFGLLMGTQQVLVIHTLDEQYFQMPLTTQSLQTLVHLR